MKTELNAMSAEFFVATSHDTPPKFSLMEKGRVAISMNGLPQVAVREVGCYVNGATRRIEQVSGELLAAARKRVKMAVKRNGTYISRVTLKLRA